jgi:hypothetical protein
MSADAICMPYLRSSAFIRGFFDWLRELRVSVVCRPDKVELVAGFL